MRKIACLALAAMMLLSTSVLAGEAFAAAKKHKTHATNTKKSHKKLSKKSKKQVASSQLPRVSGFTVSLPEENLAANPGHEDIADFKRALTTASARN